MVILYHHNNDYANKIDLTPNLGSDPVLDTFLFSSEDALCPLTFRSVLLLDRAFFFPYTLSIKKQVLSARGKVGRIHLVEKRISGTSGHSDVKTTMIYTHVLNRGPSGVRSPLDGL